MLRKALLGAALALASFVSVNVPDASALWKMNPFTQKLDYYETGGADPFTVAADTTTLGLRLNQVAIDTTSLNGLFSFYLRNDETVPAYLLDYSTISLALLTKRDKAVAITSADVDASVLIATAPAGGDLTGTLANAQVVNDSHNHSPASVTGLRVATTAVTSADVDASVRITTVPITGADIASFDHSKGTGAVTTNINGVTVNQGSVEKLVMAGAGSGGNYAIMWNVGGVWYSSNTTRAGGMLYFRDDDYPYANSSFLSTYGVSTSPVTSAYTVNNIDLTTGQHCIGTNYSNCGGKLGVAGNINIASGYGYLLNGLNLNTKGTLTNVQYRDQAVPTAIVDLSTITTALNLKAPIASPTFTGIVTAPTLNSTTITAGSVTVTGGNFSVGASTFMVSGGSVSVGNVLQFGTSPTVGAWKEGKLYYDSANKTMAADIDADVTLQIGQESLTPCKNVTGAPITNGQVVYITGGDSGYPTIAPADARYSTMSFVLGVVTTGSIADGTMGLVTVRGTVNGLDTSSWTVGSQLYLSSTTPGGLTSIQPSEGANDVRVARVLSSDATTGSILVNVRQMTLLTDLADVSVASPSAGQLLLYNGTEWVNGSGQAVAAGPGINFYYDGAIITNTGTNNVNLVETLGKTPSLAAEDVESTSVTNSTVFSEAYLYDTALGRTRIDAGPWEFFDWAGVNRTQGTTTIVRNMMRVRPSTGTITSTGTGTTRTFTCSNDTPFTASNLDVGGTLDSDSYVHTATGLFRILSRVSDTVVTAAVPTTYTNETSTMSVHKRLFQVVSDEINNLAGTAPAYTGLLMFSKKVVQPEFTFLETDKLASYRFVRATDGNPVVVYFSYGGTTRYSYLVTPLTTIHNNLPALQGGTGTGVTGEYYHLTQAKYNEVAALSTDLAGKLSKYGDTMTGQLTVSSSVVANLGNTSQHTVFTASGTINDFLQYDIQNNSNGTAAQSGYSATADNGTSTSNFLWMGINNSGFTDTSDWNTGAAGDTSILSSYNDLYIANRTAAKTIKFLTDGTKAGNVRMVIDATGTVTMNGQLTVASTTTLSTTVGTGTSIGSTSAPSKILDIWGDSSRFGPPSIDGTGPGHLRFRGGYTTIGLDMGVNGSAPYNGWIQARDIGTGAVGLKLNPIGGDVEAYSVSMTSQPCASAYPSAATVSVSSGVFVRYNFDTEAYDIASNYTNGGFTTPSAGRYLISVNTSWAASMGATTIRLGIYDNIAGTIKSWYCYQPQTSSTDNFTCSGSAVMSIAANHELSLYMGHSSSTGAHNINGSELHTNFSVCKLN